MRCVETETETAGITLCIFPNRTRETLQDLYSKMGKILLLFVTLICIQFATDYIVPALNGISVSNLI